jgi:hypothetical protein
MVGLGDVPFSTVQSTTPTCFVLLLQGSVHRNRHLGSFFQDSMDFYQVTHYCHDKDTYRQTGSLCDPRRVQPATKPAATPIVQPTANTAEPTTPQRNVSHTRSVTPQQAKSANGPANGTPRYAYISERALQWHECYQESFVGVGRSVGQIVV